MTSKTPESFVDEQQTLSTRGTKKGIRARAKNLFHWNLRSFHQHEDSFRLRDDHDDVPPNPIASELFGAQGSTGETDASPLGKTASSSSAVPTRTALIDGRHVHFELRENVTQRPTTDRLERIKRSVINKNADSSHWEVRARLFLMKLSITEVTVAYFTLFILMNTFFAGLFYAHPDGCCDDPEMSFGENFAFTVQTSTTIGYGSFSPAGSWPNFLVVALNFTSTLLNTVLAGLLFNQFVTPVAKVQFSDVITMCNVNGVPCLQLRVGNADAYRNNLTNISVRLTHLFSIRYMDSMGVEHTFGHTQELKLLSDTRSELVAVWTLRHIIDETSPLFGLNLNEYPGNAILGFQITLNGTQALSNSSISAQTSYQIDDIMIGHTFEDQITYDRALNQVEIDYGKLSNTVPSPCWYPRERM